MISRAMRRRLDPREWKVVVVDRDQTHYYQPGLLFLPFGVYKPSDVVKPKKNFLPSTVEFIHAEIEEIQPAANRVVLADKRVIPYDLMVIATGCGIVPEETEGLKDGGWRRNIFDFYTFEGAQALHKFLQGWQGGRLVLNIAELPFKCPVAPLEFLFLADWYFQKRGMRNKVELVFATPLSGAFTKPKSSEVLGGTLAAKGINVVPDFAIMEVDAGANLIRSYDGREVPYDLLVSIPVNMGAGVIGRSGLGDDLNFVPTDKFTLQSKNWENIFVMGDAASIPASKAGAVVHFQHEVVVENMLAYLAGKELHAKFDGHANCYIESGFGKAFLIDFSYDVEPLPGSYPIPGIGPFALLHESRINHLGKLAFRYMYWYLMMKGLPMPVPNQFSMAGKQP